MSDPAVVKTWVKKGSSSASAAASADSSARPPSVAATAASPSPSPSPTSSVDASSHERARQDAANKRYQAKINKAEREAQIRKERQNNTIAANDSNHPPARPISAHHPVTNGIASVSSSPPPASSSPVSPFDSSRASRGGSHNGGPRTGRGGYNGNATPRNFLGERKWSDDAPAQAAMQQTNHQSSFTTSSTASVNSAAIPRAGKKDGSGSWKREERKQQSFYSPPSHHSNNNNGAMPVTSDPSPHPSPPRGHRPTLAQPINSSASASIVPAVAAHHPMRPPISHGVAAHMMTATLMQPQQPTRPPVPFKAKVQNEIPAHEQTTTPVTPVAPSESIPLDSSTPIIASLPARPASASVSSSSSYSSSSSSRSALVDRNASPGKLAALAKAKAAGEAKRAAEARAAAAKSNATIAAPASAHTIPPMHSAPTNARLTNTRGAPNANNYNATGATNAAAVPTSVAVAAAPRPTEPARFSYAAIASKQPAKERTESEKRIESNHGTNATATVPAATSAVPAAVTPATAAATSLPPSSATLPSAIAPVTSSSSSAAAPLAPSSPAPRAVVLSFNIETHAGNQPLSMYEGDNPNEVAEAFCKKWNHEAMKEAIAMIIVETMQGMGLGDKIKTPTSTQ